VATVSAGRSDPLTTKIMAEIAPLARDVAPGGLSLRLAAQESLPLELTVQHTAAFSVVTVVGQGPLPATVAPRGSMPELQGELEQRLADVREDAGALIDAWADEHAGAYRSVLPPERCMAERPVLGVQEVCGNCHGRREVTCGGCAGAGRVTCGSCGGRARVACSSCGGSRATRCMSCGGSGTHEVREFEVSYTDRQNTMNQQRQLTRQVPCPGCGGRGSNPCGACGDGTQPCSCGNGYVTCGSCGGRGIVACPTCAATGAVHHTGRVHCTVNRGVRVDVSSSTAEDQHTFRERVPFDAIDAMASRTGGVPLQRRDRVKHQVTLVYTASIPLEAAEGTVRGERVAIRAYGPGRDIYDYHDLVGKLLEPDLAALEGSLRETSAFALGPGASLAGVTKTFLSSEVNALIAEVAPQVDQDVALTPGGRRRVSVERVIQQSLILAPVVRRFRAAGIAFKLVMIAVGVGLVSHPVQSYVALALLGAFFEWRYQRDRAPETPAARPSSDPGAAASERAATSLQASVATGMVSPAYVQRATAAIARAVPRLFGPLVLPMALWVAAGTTALFVVARTVFLIRDETPTALVLLALTALTWLLLERRAYASLEAMLGPHLYGRLEGQFGQTRNRYRLLVVAGFLLSWFVSDFIVAFIATVRHGSPLL
jgi:hypothetical protein